ncbi:MAG: LytR C-terminal domain-containing protein [Propionibacteriaceae bacterium]|nr:LytR C-terminal domain-containing protein [Propionibacteriaceae bacterium]
MAARPPFWRTAALLTAMVVVLLATGLAGFHALTSQPKVEQTPCATQTVTGSISTTDVGVRVYNYQGGTVGLATSLGGKLADAGFKVTYIGNIPPKQDVPASTTIVGGKADDPEVQLVSGFFPDSITQADGRTDHSVDVLIGATWAGFDTSFKGDAPPHVYVSKATICPPIITPGATPTDTPTPTDTSTDTPTDEPTDTSTP